LTAIFWHVIMIIMEPEKSDISRLAQGEQEIPEEQATYQLGFIGRLMDALTHSGLGEVTVRVGTNIFAISLIVLVVWLMGTFYKQSMSGGASSVYAASAPTTTPPVSAAFLPMPEVDSSAGISRQTSLHTSIPSRPRIDVIEYTVQKGDTLFGIALKFGLNPSTILFGNYAVLKDTPHSLRPDQVLHILPVDGTYYEWNPTDTLTGVGRFFGVDPEVIVNYPGNHLDPDTIGDYENPAITSGTMLIIPGGKREFISWSAPIGVTRDNPAIARIMGEAPLFGLQTSIICLAMTILQKQITVPSI
jgi:hypothetical protein